jgi:uncharacterized cupredoxin-like copper-binding protein
MLAPEEESPMSRIRVSAAIAVAITLGVAGCTGTSPTPSSGEEATTVDVTLQEWAVVPAATSAPAGEVTFHVTNDGPEDVHEFVVIQTDLAHGDLPVDDTGTVDEEGEGMTVVDEIEDIPVGESQDLTVTLEAGSYVLVCNIYSEDELESHYQMGMHIGFTAE